LLELNQLWIQILKQEHFFHQYNALELKIKKFCIKLKALFFYKNLNKKIIHIKRRSVHNTCEFAGRSLFKTSLTIPSRSNAGSNDCNTRERAWKQK